MKLLLLGCTGFIGRELAPLLLNKGHKITLVSRKAAEEFSMNDDKTNYSFINVNPSIQSNWRENSPLYEALKESEGVINLAGEPIAEKRWNTNQCLEIEQSRLSTTQSLVNSIGNLRNPPRVLINGSAIGAYGTSEEKIFNEESPFGNDFLANLCKQWEGIALEKPKRTRLILLRIGIVLGSDGGALGKMLPVFRAGLGGPIGNGSQWMSWIHRTDLCELISQSLINRNYSGVINCVTPNPVTMSEFAKDLGKCLNKPSLISLPGPILRILLGDGAQVVLKGQKVESNKIKKLNFIFRYPSLDEALKSATN